MALNYPTTHTYSQDKDLQLINPTWTNTTFTSPKLTCYKSGRLAVLQGQLEVARDGNNSGSIALGRLPDTVWPRHIVRWGHTGWMAYVGMFQVCYWLQTDGQLYMIITGSKTGGEIPCTTAWITKN